MPRRKVFPHQGGNMLKKIAPILKEANKIARQTKIVSSVLGAVPNPGAQRVGAIARTLGYGKRSRRKLRRRRMRGRGSTLLNPNLLGIGYQPAHPMF